MLKIKIIFYVFVFFLFIGGIRELQKTDKETSTQGTIVSFVSEDSFDTAGAAAGALMGQSFGRGGNGMFYGAVAGGLLFGGGCKEMIDVGDEHFTWTEGATITCRKTYKALETTHIIELTKHQIYRGEKLLEEFYTLRQKRLYKIKS